MSKEVLLALSDLFVTLSPFLGTLQGTKQEVSRRVLFCFRLMNKQMNTLIWIRMLSQILLCHDLSFQHCPFGNHFDKAYPSHLEFRITSPRPSKLSAMEGTRLENNKIYFHLGPKIHPLSTVVDRHCSRCHLITIFCLKIVLTHLPQRNLILVFLKELILSFKKSEK